MQAEGGEGIPARTLNIGASTFTNSRPTLVTVYGACGQHGPRQCGHRNRCGLYNNLLYSDKAGLPDWSAGGHTYFCDVF